MHLVESLCLLLCDICGISGIRPDYMIKMNISTSFIYFL